MSKRRGSNEGSIYRMKDGRWRAAISLGYRNGKRFRKVFTGKTRREVHEKLTGALRSHQRGVPVEPSRLTVGQFLTPARMPSIRASGVRRNLGIGQTARR